SAQIRSSAAVSRFTRAVRYCSIAARTSCSAVLLSAELGVWVNASGNATKLIRPARSKGFMQSASLVTERCQRNQDGARGMERGVGRSEISRLRQNAAAAVAVTCVVFHGCF